MDDTRALFEACRRHSEDHVVQDVLPPWERGMTDLRMLRDSDSQESLLHVACHRGSTLIVDYLLRRQLPVAGLDAQGDTPLHVASWRGDIDIMEKLILRHADVNADNRYGESPLHYACRPPHGSKAAVVLLRTRGAQISEDSRGKTPLGACGYRTDVAAVLLDGSNLDWVGDKLETLAGALYHGKLAFVECLLSHTRYTFSRFKLLLQALTNACEWRRSVVFDSMMGMVEGGTDLLPGGKHALLNVACTLGFEKVIRLLIVKGADVRRVLFDLTPLHAACGSPSAQVITLLLEHGADIEAVSSDGFTPLHTATSQGQSAHVSVLMQHQADVDARHSPSGNTPLHLACRYGYVDIVMMLLSKGADAGAQNLRGHSVKDVALSLGNGSLVDLIHRHVG